LIKLNKYLENKTYEQDNYEWTILSSEWSNTYQTILVNIRPKPLKKGNGKQIAKGPPKTSEQRQDLLEAISCVGAERWATSNIRKEIRDIVEAAGGKFSTQLSEISQEGASKREIESSPGLNQAHHPNSKRGDKKRRSSSPVTEGSVLGGGGPGGEESRQHQHQLSDSERMEEATPTAVNEFEKVRDENILRNSQFLEALGFTSNITTTPHSRNRGKGRPVGSKNKPREQIWVEQSGQPVQQIATTAQANSWVPQTMSIDQRNIFEARPEDILISQPLNKSVFSSLGEPRIKLWDKACLLTLEAFNHVLKEIQKHPEKVEGYRKFAALPTLLLIQTDSIRTMAEKVKLVLEDKWDVITFNVFKGKYDKDKPTLTKPKLSEAEAEWERKKKRMWRNLKVGEIGKAFKVLVQERASMAASEVGFNAVRGKFPSKVRGCENDWNQAVQQASAELMTGDYPKHIASINQVVAAVNKLTKATRHGHDNMPSDVLKDLVKFAERNTTNQLATEFLELFTEFINLTFIDHKCPKEVREFYNGGEVFGLTTAVKANRPITMATTYSKVAETIGLNSIMERATILFKGIQYGVGTKFGTEKMTHTTRLSMELQPTFDKVQGDISNAFPSLEPSAVISKVVEVFPDMLHQLLPILTEQNSVWYNGTTAGPLCIPTNGRILMGKTAGPFMYALGTHDGNVEANRLAGPGGCQKTYLDDNFLCAQTPNMHEAITHLVRTGEKIGTTQNLDKGRVLVGVKASLEEAERVAQGYVERGYKADQVAVHPENSGAPETYGVQSMGLPIGTPEFVQRALLLGPVPQLDREFDVLNRLAVTEPQVAFLFLRIVFAGKLTHYLRGLLPSQVSPVLQIFHTRQHQVLTTILRVSRVSDRSYELAMMAMSNGGGGLANPQLAAPAAFVGSLVACLQELEESFPGFTQMLKDENTSCPTAVEFQRAISELARYDAEISTELVLSLAQEEADKLQHFMYRKVRAKVAEDWTVQQQDDKVALAIVQSGSTQAAYAWVEAIPKTAKTTMEATVFSDALRRRLLVNNPMIPTGMTCVCKAHLDELGTHLQMCKFKNGLTIRTHDLLNREIAEFHKGMGFSTTLVVKPQFQSADDPDVRTKTDQVILRSGLPPLSIDTTISNVCSDQSLKSMKGKPKYLAVASSREQSKINDYMEECRKIGHDFLPAAFECQGSIGQMFAQHFENCVQKRAEELGMKSPGPLRWYWRQRLSIALQRHVSQACNERMYAMQMHRHIDESSHEGFHQEYARSNVGPMSVDGV